MGRDYTPGLYTVTSWSIGALLGANDPRVVYRGEDAREAARVFEGLSMWKKRGIVQMTSPIGLVSTDCKPDAASKIAPWSTRYAHPDYFEGAPK